MENQLDQSVVNLAKAIRQTESGGNFTAKGKSGEHGAYQFTPDTWNAQAPKYGINVPIEKATPEQQNAVAYNKIKEWKDKGHDVTQIASMWNAGEGEPNAYTGKFGSNAGSHKSGDPSIGVNKYGAKYDVPAYAKSVSKAYLTLKNGGEVKNDPNNPSSTEKKLTFDDIPHGTPSTNEKGLLGENKNDSIYGKIIDNSITRGIRGVGNFVTGGGTETLGKTLGTAGGALYTKGKDLITGSKDYENYDLSAPSPLENIGAGIKTVGAASGIKGLGGLLAGALSKGTALGGIRLSSILEKEAPRMVKEFNSGSPSKQYDVLKVLLDRVSPSARLVIEKALQELEPLVAKEQGLTPGLLKKTLTKSGGLIKKGIRGAIGATGLGGTALAVYDHYKK